MAMASLAPTPSFSSAWPSVASNIAAPNLLFDQGGGLYFPVDDGRTDHPDTWHLVGLVSEAVLEVVCVSSLGYIAASRGLFSSKVQRDVATLNIYFFTPCLIFSKLARQLTGEKLTELWIIPIILFVQTMVSWGAAEAGTRLLKINKKPQRNFVKAMAVFGNSNSLPLSLVISLSHTISGLHWDQVPGDNDDEVGARGILYLLIFSQLGQAVRWSWGMNTLLKPLSDYTPEERGEVPRDEEHYEPYTDEPRITIDDPNLLSFTDASQSGTSTPGRVHQVKTDDFSATTSDDEMPTPNGNGGPHNRSLSRIKDSERRPRSRSPLVIAARGAVQFSRVRVKRMKGWRNKNWIRFKESAGKNWESLASAAASVGRTFLAALPPALQKVLTQTFHYIYIFLAKIISCLNVPLCAIVVSVLVGSIPSLKAFFYTPGSFVNNTVTSAVNQLGGVAVPLILFVLGGNLCKSTAPSEELENREYRSERSRMVWCAVVCRMVVPLLAMAPFLALIAKFTPISILDDPIFIIVCFLLTGAPSALQLAQICQVNDVFVPVISKLLVQSYVVWIFPSTLVLVMLALEVVKWAQ